MQDALDASSQILNAFDARRPIPERIVDFYPSPENLFADEKERDAQKSISDADYHALRHSCDIPQTVGRYFIGSHGYEYTLSPATHDEQGVRISEKITTGSSSFYRVATRYGETFYVNAGDISNEKIKTVSAQSAIGESIHDFLKNIDSYKNLPDFRDALRDTTSSLIDGGNFSVLGEYNKIFVREVSDFSNKINDAFTKIADDRYAADFLDSGLLQYVDSQNLASPKGKEICAKGLSNVDMFELCSNIDSYAQVPGIQDRILVLLATTKDYEWRDFVAHFKDFLTLFDSVRRNGELLDACFSSTINGEYPCVLHATRQSIQSLVSCPELPEGIRYNILNAVNAREPGLLLEYFSSYKDIPGAETYFRHAAEVIQITDPQLVVSIYDKLKDAPDGFDTATLMKNSVNYAIRSAYRNGSQLAANLLPIMNETYFKEEFEKGFDELAKRSPDESCNILNEFYRSENQSAKQLAEESLKNHPDLILNAIKHDVNVLAWNKELLEKPAVKEVVISNLKEIKKEIRKYPFGAGVHASSNLIRIGNALHGVLNGLPEEQNMLSISIFSLLADQASYVKYMDLDDLARSKCLSQDQKMNVVFVYGKRMPLDVFNSAEQLGLSSADLNSFFEDILNRGNVHFVELLNSMLRSDSAAKINEAAKVALLQKVSLESPDFLLRNKDDGRLKDFGLDQTILSASEQNIFLLSALRPTSALTGAPVEGNELSDPAVNIVARSISKDWLPAQPNEKVLAKIIIAVARYIYSDRLARSESNFVTTREEVNEVYQKLNAAHEQYKDVPLFSGRNVIIASNTERIDDNPLNKQYGFEGDRFGRQELVTSIKNQQSQSGSLSHLEPPHDSDQNRLEEEKNKILDTLKNTQPPLTFVFDGHGNPEGLYLSDGKPLPDGKFEEGVRISLNDMVEVFKKRSETFGRENVKGDIIILSACYNQDFIRAMYSRLKEEKAGMPIAIGMSEYGKAGYSNYKNKFGSDFFDKVLKVESARSTLSNVWENDDMLEGMNPSSFISIDDTPLQTSENSPGKNDQTAAAA